MNKSHIDDFYKYFKNVTSVCLLFAIPLSFFLFCTSVSAEDADSQHHILLINSYHKGFMWSDEITRGVEENLAENGVMLHVEYMDTKRHFDEKYFSILSQMFSVKHSKYQYDVIMVSDNNAFEFITNRAKNIFGDIPVVFCGLNYLTEEEIKGMTHVSGVTEEADLESNIKLIEQLHPEREKLIVLTDNTITGEKIQQEVKRIKSLRADLGVDIELVFDVSTDELIAKLSDLDDQTSLLFTLFFRDRKGTFLEYDDGIALVVAHTTVPIYVCWDFSMRDGVMGGFLTDGYDQGAEAAKKVNEILTGRPISEIPVTWKSPTRLFLDYFSLKKFDVSLNDVPSGAEIGNLPLTFLQEYKELIIKVSIVVGVLLLVVIALAYGLIRSRRAEETLRKAENFISKIINSTFGIKNAGQ
jgi:ABC-type uncharacterized transport system substrate-binding protein